MTRSEYSNLIEFLGRKFEGVEVRLSGVEGRLAGMDERLTRVEILCEDNQHKIQIVAEGVVALREEMVRGFRDQRLLIDSLGDRVTRLEARIA